MMSDITTSVNKSLSESIRLNLNFIESQFGIKVGHRFVSSRAPNINLYCSIRPYRMLEGNPEEYNFSKEIRDGDFLGDIKLQRSQFVLVAFMKTTRKYLYSKIYFDEDGLNDKFLDGLKKELQHIIRAWTFEFEEFSDDGQYLVMGYHDAFSLKDNDFISFFPIHSFLIEHEIGHLFYNVFVKDVYNGGFTGKEFNLKKLEAIMERVVSNFQQSHQGEIDHKDNWIEELVADAFGYQICCRLNYPNIEIPPFYVAIYGIAFSLIILILNTKYFNKIGFDSTPGTHPDHYLRLNSLDNFVDTINTGKYPDQYMLTKKFIHKAKEAINFIEFLIKEV